MAFPKKAYTNDEAQGAMLNAASAAGLDLSGLSPINAIASAVANIFEDDPSTLTIPAANVDAGSFPTGVFAFTDATDASNSTTAAVKIAGGLAVAKKLYVGTTGNFGGALTIGGALSGVTSLTATSDVMAGAAAYVGFTGRSAISSPSDGTLKLSNATGTAFSAVYFGQEAGATTSKRLQKAVASIADNTDTAVFTVTVPNAAHSATLRVTLAGSLGAGGAVGANEATHSISYDIAIARTAGVATVATVSTAYGSANSAVAGAATITVAGSVSAMTGAVSAQQTFTVLVKITKGDGASDNHTCLALAELVNANATGISIA